MAVFLITYDLRGRDPDHDRMRDAIGALLPGAYRIATTTWLADTGKSLAAVRDALWRECDDDDVLFLVHIPSIEHFDGVVGERAGDAAEAARIARFFE